MRALRPSALQDGELLAKGEDLELERRSAADGRDHYRGARGRFSCATRYVSRAETVNDFTHRWGFQ